MLALHVQGPCRKDMRLAKKRGKDMEKLWAVIDRLQKPEPLDARHRVHRLSGDWDSCWECHVEPDWLLVYYMTDTKLTLIRLGTHSDLFG